MISSIVIIVTALIVSVFTASNAIVMGVKMTLARTTKTETVTLTALQTVKDAHGQQPLV